MATDSPSSSSRSRSWPAASSSHPPSRYITSNCGAGGRAASSGAARRGAGSYTLRLGAWPVIVERSASRSTSRPRPPASTTPASPSTSNCSGVFSSATTAASPAAVTACGSPSPAFAAFSTASPAAFSTETIVPLTSRPPIEATTSSTPRCSAAPSNAASMSRSSPPESAAACAVTSAMPRRICDRITPELPRAPLSAPDDRAAAVLATSADFASVLASASAERMVNSMLTPVSASATGNTLSRLISSMWVIRSPTAVCAQSRNADASSARLGPASPDPTLVPPPRAYLGGRQPIHSRRQHRSHDTRRLLIVLAVLPGGSYPFAGRRATRNVVEVVGPRV